MQIKSNGKAVKILSETKAGTNLPVLVELNKPVYPGENVELDISFAATVAEYAGIEEVKLTSWYPCLDWGFETHDDYDVKIDKTSEYLLATSGTLASKSGYFHAENVRSFGLFLGKDYKVIEAKAKDVLVQVVYKTQAEECAQLVLETAVETINFYRERFGLYPYRSLVIIPGGMTHPAGGYPVATSMVGIHAMEQFDSKPKTFWQWITAHEIGHQYWGEYVLSKDISDSFNWLMIGLGIYTDRELTRAHGINSQIHRSGFVQTYIKGVRKGFDTTINITPEQRSRIKFDFNNIVKHGKSYSVISALDCVLGEKVFDTIYRRCLKEFAGRRLGVSDFQTICEEESDQDLGWFFEQWVNSNKYLSYEISSKKSEKKGGLYISDIEVNCLGDLKMPVPVTAYFEDGSSQTKFTDRALQNNILRFESKTALKDAVLDANGKLALVVPPPAPDEAQLTSMVKELPWTGAGSNALEVFKKVKQGKMTDPGAWFKLGLTLYDGKYYPQAIKAFRNTQQLSEKNSNDYLVSLVWQGHISDLLGQRNQALNYYEQVLKQDNNFGMQHSQYQMRINRDWVKERINKPFER
ncbi:M1 family aminopeptidase [Planctomycetota bacterium]